jgi:hypothetical protein
MNFLNDSVHIGVNGFVHSAQIKANQPNIIAGTERESTRHLPNQHTSA